MSMIILFSKFVIKRGRVSEKWHQISQTLRYSSISPGYTGTRNHFAFNFLCFGLVLEDASVLLVVSRRFVKVSRKCAHTCSFLSSSFHDLTTHRRAPRRLASRRRCASDPRRNYFHHLCRTHIQLHCSDLWDARLPLWLLCTRLPGVVKRDLSFTATRIEIPWLFVIVLSASECQQ